MRTVLTGSGAARGMTLGRALLRQPSRYPIDERILGEDEVEGELLRLQAAIAAARRELKTLGDSLQDTPVRELAELIEAHSMMLADPGFSAGLATLIREQRRTASAALQAQHDRLVAIFESMADPYLRDRREDIDHLIGRVQGHLAEAVHSTERRVAARMGEILVSDTISPADMMPLARHGILGFVLDAGSVLSHSAILARSLRLPMVIGVDAGCQTIHDDDLLLVDGYRGEVIVHPTAQDLARFRQWQRDQIIRDKRLAQLRHTKTETRDGVPIALYGNAEAPADIHFARDAGAAGIGLFRTESLFLEGRGLPDEERQFRTYRDAVLAMGGLPITIRTLDLGADKADGTGLALDSEPNPALGLRGVRLSLRRPRLMHTQLRAILRASAYGPVRLLIPMVSGCEEVIAVQRALATCAAELRDEGLELPGRIDIGAMIEVPAAAIMLPALIEHLDFVAIGSNDLVQYTLAADRNNDDMGDLYDPMHPAVIQLIANTISTTIRAGRRVALCGEIAGDIEYVPLLLALGMTELSMHPQLILEVRELVNELDFKALRKHAPALLAAPDRATIQAISAALRVS